MASARVRLKSRGMEQLLKSSGVRGTITDRAERVLSRARSDAPVASGEYRNSLRVVQATTDRAVARVMSDAPHAWVVEIRTGNLARSLDAA